MKPALKIYQRVKIAKTFEMENDRQREFLVEYYSKKISQHFQYIFTLIASLWGFFNVINPIKNITSKLTSSMFTSFIIIAIIWNIGRLIYWSTFNQHLLSFRGIDIPDNVRNAKSNNYKIRIIHSIKKYIELDVKNHEHLTQDKNGVYYLDKQKLKPRVIYKLRISKYFSYYRPIQLIHFLILFIIMSRILYIIWNNNMELLLCFIS